VADEKSLSEDSLSLTHRPSQLRFVAVPGGELKMGLSPTDLEDLSEHVPWTAAVAKLVERLEKQASPVHNVGVGPFLCSRRLLMTADVQRATGGRFHEDSPTRETSRAIAVAAGFRLPSEAELEWLLRDGGDTRIRVTLDGAEVPSCFGIEMLVLGQWAEDDWHPSYVGAPVSSAPWLGPASAGVYRGGRSPEEIQSDEERTFLLAGVRGKGGEDEPSLVGVRLALDLPGDAS